MANAETVVWEAKNAKGKSYVSVKKSKPVTFEGSLTGPTRFFMRVWTDEKTPAPIRCIKLHLEITEASGKVLRVKKSISSKTEKFEYRFSVAASATWKLELTSPAILKAVKGFGVIYKISDFQPDDELMVDNVSIYEREMFSVDQLDEEERKKVFPTSLPTPPL